MRRAVALAVASVMVTGAMVGVAPSAAFAAPTICEPNFSWYDINTTKRTLKILAGEVHAAPSSAPLSVTTNWSKTVEFNASYSASIGGNLSIEVPVRGFNIGAGLETSTEAAMDVKISKTVSVTQNIVIPKGHRMLQYGGVQFTKTTISSKKCSGNGQKVNSVWSGTLTGPRYTESGWIDCKDTTYC